MTYPIDREAELFAENCNIFYVLV